jgi:hypothetical protein
MTGFEFLFSFYGLVLGLAVANVASSFAKMYADRAEISVGWAPPLLGIVILSAAMQQWVSFWGGRDVLTMGPWELLTCLGMALPYIFVSEAVLLRRGSTSGSLEQHYLDERLVLLGVLFVPILVSATYNFSHGATGDAIVSLALLYGHRALILAVLLLWKNIWAHRVGLALLAASNLVELFA